MKSDPKDKKQEKDKVADDKKEVTKDPEQPEYDDTVDYKNDDETDIDKSEYFEK